MSSVSICQRCAESQRTCCQTREVYVSPGDLQRIAAHTGRRADDIVVSAVADPEYRDQPDDEAWLAIFDADGRRRVLKHRDTGGCTFLGDAGCELPAEVRPRICLLYPFDYTAKGLRQELSHMCPTELLPAGQTLLDALDMDRARTEPLRLQLYAEIADEPAQRVPPCA